MEKSVEEKAKYLILKFGTKSEEVCDEILGSIPKLVPGYGFGSALFENPDIKFWNEVKEEIIKQKTNGTGK